MNPDVFQNPPVENRGMDRVIQDEDFYDAQEQVDVEMVAPVPALAPDDLSDEERNEENESDEDEDQDQDQDQDANDEDEDEDEDEDVEFFLAPGNFEEGAPFQWLPDTDHEYPDHADEKIYEGANLSVLESFLILLQLFLRFQFSKVQMDAICQTVSMHCPGNNLCAKSEAGVRDFFSGIEAGEILVHDFCPTCCHLFDGNEIHCPVCPDQPLREQPGKKKTFFLEFPIEKELYKRFAGIFELVPKRVTD